MSDYFFRTESKPTACINHFGSSHLIYCYTVTATEFSHCYIVYNNFIATLFAN